MTRVVTPCLVPFVDPLPVPPRLLAPQHDGRLTIAIRAGAHRFHRDLPESPIWGFDGTVPGPTIEAERAQPVRVEWRNDRHGGSAGLPRDLAARPTPDRRGGFQEWLPR